MLLFNYTKAMNQVRELRSIANDMRNMRGRMLSDAINNTKTAWKGPTADQFVRKCEDYVTVIDREIRNIITVADSLERTSRTIEENERRAASILTGGIIR